MRELYIPENQVSVLVLWLSLSSETMRFKRRGCIITLHDTDISDTGTSGEFFYTF